MTNESIIEKYLIKYYQVPKILAKRYAKMLATRWILWAIDSHLDASTVSEDLYQETKDWETPDYMSENINKFVKMKLPFPNLDYTEKILKEDIKNLFK